MLADGCTRNRGWDETGSNGANLSFPQEFGIDFSNGGPNASVNQWIVGVINSGLVTLGRILNICQLNRFLSLVHISQRLY